MSFRIEKVGSGFHADKELLEFLNALPDTTRVVQVIPGRFGKWHGLDEEHEHGYKVLLQELAK